MAVPEIKILDLRFQKLSVGMLYNMIMRVNSKSLDVICNYCKSCCPGNTVVLGNLTEIYHVDCVVNEYLIGLGQLKTVEPVSTKRNFAIFINILDRGTCCRNNGQ